MSKNSSLYLDFQDSKFINQPSHRNSNLWSAMSLNFGKKKKSNYKTQFYKKRKDRNLHQIKISFYEQPHSK